MSEVESPSAAHRLTFVPLAIKHRHSSELVVPPVSAVAVKTTSPFDLPLIRALGKAFYWEKMLDAGEVANASELARRFKLEPGWVSEVLRMTWLAPDISQRAEMSRTCHHTQIRPTPRVVRGKSRNNKTN